MFDGVLLPCYCGHVAGGQVLLWRCFQEEFWPTPAWSNDMFICNVWSQEISLGDRELVTSTQKEASFALNL